MLADEMPRVLGPRAAPNARILCEYWEYEQYRTPSASSIGSTQPPEIVPITREYL